MKFSHALECAKDGKAIARQSETFEPTALILMPGRSFTANFGQMVNHIGQTKMTVRDHFDAVIYRDGEWYCRVGYVFSQDDILAEDWFHVDKASDLIDENC